MAAAQHATWDLKHMPRSSAAVTTGRSKLWSKARKFVLIGTQVLFALGVYSYVAWCVLR